MLSACVYIDLNPLAAGIAQTPQASRHTSVRQRIQHAQKHGNLSDLKAAARGSVPGSRAAGRLEESHWLCPLQDLRQQGSVRAGMLENFSLGSYLLLLDYSSRLRRAGQGRVSKAVRRILDRLGTGPELWEQRLQKLFSKPRIMGSYFATSPDRLKDVAARRGVHHVDNAVSWA